MTSFVEAFEEFNFPRTSSSCDLDTSSSSSSSSPRMRRSASASMEGNTLMRCLGKLNHTYESTDSLTSMNSSGSLSSLGSAQDLSMLVAAKSVFSAVESLTLNSHTQSNNNLASMVDAADVPMPQQETTTLLSSFFLALEEFLNVNKELNDSEIREVRTYIPKFC